MTPDEVRALAIKGVQVEIERLNAMLNALQTRKRGSALRVETVKRTRRPMSAAARKRQAERMKAYWAARRKKTTGD